MQSMGISIRLGGFAATLFGATALLLATAPTAQADHERAVARHGAHAEAGHSDRHRGGRAFVFGDRDPRRAAPRHHGHHDRRARRHSRYERRHDRWHHRHDRRRYEDRHHHRHDRAWREHRRGHHDRYSRHHQRPHAKVHGYYCASCSRHFQSRHGLSDHVHRHHRVPLVRLPFVIVKSLFGWVFYG